MDRLEEEVETAKAEAKAKVMADASKKGQAKGHAGTGTETQPAGVKSPAKSPAKSSAKAAKPAVEELPSVNEIFAIGQSVVLYAGEQKDYKPIAQHHVPKPHEYVSSSGLLVKNVPLLRGTIVANEEDDLVPSHVTEGAEYPLTEGLVGIKVRCSILQHSCSISSACCRVLSASR